MVNEQIVVDGQGVVLGVSVWNGGSLYGLDGPTRPAPRLRWARYDTGAAWRQADGTCRSCRAPRGPDGTENHCRRCANIRSAEERDRQRGLVAAGRCRECGRPRGPDGTGTRCRRCAHG